MLSINVWPVAGLVVATLDGKKLDADKVVFTKNKDGSYAVAITNGEQTRHLTKGTDAESDSAAKARADIEKYFDEDD